MMIDEYVGEERVFITHHDDETISRQIRIEIYIGRKVRRSDGFEV